jgi:hypothetical protein
MSDEYKNIDDLFRDKFKDFELDPPDHIWGNIKTHMHGPGSGGNGSNFNKGGIYGISIILIVTGILSWYLLSSSDEADEQIPIENITQAEDKEYKSSTRMISVNTEDEKKEDVDFSNKGVNSLLKNKKKQKARFDISEPAEVSPGKTSLVVQENVQSPDVKNSNDITVNENHESISILTPGGDKELLAIHDTFESEVEITKTIPSNEAENTISTSSNEQINEDSETLAGLETVSEVRSDYGQKGKWMFGLFFTPEMIFYPDNNSLNNRSYSLDVNAIYKFNGYFLQSGLGASWTSDKGKCEIDYNEYLGSYQDVYDVTFDTIGNELSPVYHTETVQVYDSIDRVSIMPAKNHYTYLQIPLLFGYGNENRRFGWFVKAGPSISIMVHQDLSSNDMSGSEDKILRIENEVPSRINTNWQFVFAGGLSYKLSNHLSLSAEPVIRYYLNSTYEKSQYNAKNPYSIGLRVGFLIDL